MTIQTLLDLLGENSSPKYQRKQVLEFVRGLLGVPYIHAYTHWVGNSTRSNNNYYVVTVDGARKTLELGPNEWIHKQG